MAWSNSGRYLATQPSYVPGHRFRPFHRYRLKEYVLQHLVVLHHRHQGKILVADRRKVTTMAASVGWPKVSWFNRCTWSRLRGSSVRICSVIPLAPGCLALVLLQG
ncbi:hypothetical protein DFAR_3860005 [Desulfarculales bacterium]